MENMAGLKVVTSAISLSDLFVDVLQPICKYLDMKSRGRLARTCTALRDVLYDPIFWGDAHIVTIDTVNSEAGQCIVKRNIKYLLRIYMRNVDNTSTELLGLLKDSTFKSSLKTLRLELASIDDCNMLDEFYTEAKSVTDTFQNLCCLIVCIHLCDNEELDKDHIYKVFHVIFPMMPQLTKLHIYQESLGIQESCLDTIKLSLEPILNKHLPKLLKLDYQIFDAYQGFVCHYEDQINHTYLASATNLT